MGLFDKLRDPVILKEDSEATVQLEQLTAYLAAAPAEIKPQIEQDIKLVQLGINGEENLLFELKNSHMPMYIMHDLFFERDGLTTQIDYLVVTRKTIIVIECKNLYGEIDIDNQGNFTRKVQLGNRYVKKGIYSPVTQNQRHLDMIHEIRRESKPMLMRNSFDKYFDDIYKSIIVLANPSSVLNMRYAPADIKSRVIKADRLNSYIKELNEKTTAAKMSDKEMKELADFFLEKSIKNTKDYTEKYKNAVITAAQAAPNSAFAQQTMPYNRPAAAPAASNAAFAQQTVQYNNQAAAPVVPNAAFVQQTAPYNNQAAAPSPEAPSSGLEALPVYQALKSYRYNKSREENIKSYFIYNNAQLEEIIRSSPANMYQLKQIPGFGDKKCEKYGEDILRILSEYR